ncbi:hypothetical protein SK854_23945 [Lentzea sp. BCCO 10_0061]|uniref:Uncharacterized protein n=1 Tax=Lentzea sokolovensis TaxID=3095429 RepID=A0ABU4V0D3_9PSEU|nr:hypothetical protein [Lentzea sp. BCCO 10_0061]MDX8145184.1 hypothetical protein [Lentzea sp. BCCO 10_0061]
MIRAVLTTTALLLATAAPASAATGSLVWDSDAGAWPTEGRSGTWTPPGLFSVREAPEEDNLIRIKGESPDEQEFLEIRLYRHDGQRITEGHFEDQKVLVVNHGFGWYDNAGDFDVEHIAYNDEGLISEFDGAIEHHYRDKPDSTFRAKVSYRR